MQGKSRSIVLVTVVFLLAVGAGLLVWKYTISGKKPSPVPTRDEVEIQKLTALLEKWGTSKDQATLAEIDRLLSESPRHGAKLLAAVAIDPNSLQLRSAIAQVAGKLAREDFLPVLAIIVRLSCQESQSGQAREPEAAIQALSSIALVGGKAAVGILMELTGWLDKRGGQEEQAAGVTEILLKAMQDAIVAAATDEDINRLQDMLAKLGNENARKAVEEAIQGVSEKSEDLQVEKELLGLDLRLPASVERLRKELFSGAKPGIQVLCIRRAQQIIAGPDDDTPGPAAVQETAFQLLKDIVLSACPGSDAFEETGPLSDSVIHQAVLALVELGTGKKEVISSRSRDIVGEILLTEGAPGNASLLQRWNLLRTTFLQTVGKFGDSRYIPVLEAVAEKTTDPEFSKMITETLEETRKQPK